MIKFWKHHSLSIVLGVIFFSMFIASWPLGKTTWDGKGSYFGYWLAQSIWALQGDFCGGLILVLFTKWFREYRSAASNDTPEEIMEKAAGVVEDTQDDMATLKMKQP